MNTLPSSSLTIPPRPVRAPQKHRAGTRGPGGGPFQPLRCREVSPCSRAAGERGSVRHPTARRAGTGSGHWAPRGGGRGPGSKACEPSPGDGVSGRLPCPDEVEQEEGKRPGSPAPALPAESREMGTHPRLLRSCPRGAALQGLSGRSSASRVPPLRGSAVALLPGAVRRLGCTGRVLPCRAHGPAAAACEEPGVGAGVHAWCSVHHHSSPACPPSLSTVYKKLILQRTGTSPLDTGWHLPADHWVGLHT